MRGHFECQTRLRLLMWAFAQKWPTEWGLGPFVRAPGVRALFSFMGRKGLGQ